MIVSRRTELILGLIVPLVIVIGLAFLASKLEAPGTAIAFMATAPLIAAMFTRALFTGIVSLATIIVAAISTAMSFPRAFYSVLWIVVGVVIAAGIAVISSQAKSVAPPRASGAPAPSGNGPTPVAEASEQIDGLTGLPTRYGLKQALEADTAPGRRVVAVIDCDHLVVVNDTFGRAVGDTFLFAVAGRTRYALPENDVVARWGDEEFVLVTRASDEEVGPLLELIADKVNQNPIRTDAGLIPQTISVGAAVWPEGGTFEDAFEVARRALYRAKAEGGARLVVEGITV